jgi:hypothetical protein
LEQKIIKAQHQTKEKYEMILKKLIDFKALDDLKNKITKGKITLVIDYGQDKKI